MTKINHRKPPDTFIRSCVKHGRKEKQVKEKNPDLHLAMCPCINYLAAVGTTVVGGYFLIDKV